MVSLQRVCEEIERISYSRNNDNPFSKSTSSLLRSTRRSSSTIASFWKRGSDEVLEDLLAAIVGSTFSELYSTKHVGGPWHGTSNLWESLKLLLCWDNLTILIHVIVMDGLEDIGVMTVKSSENWLGSRREGIVDNVFLYEVLVLVWH